MNRWDATWQRLIKAARTAPRPETPAAAPYGFAGRVVARWQAAPSPSLLGVWEFLSVRVLAFGCAVMVISLVTGYGVIREEWVETPSVTETVANLTDNQIEMVVLP